MWKWCHDPIGIENEESWANERPWVTQLQPFSDPPTLPDNWASVKPMLKWHIYALKLIEYCEGNKRTHQSEASVSSIWPIRRFVWLDQSELRSPCLAWPPTPRMTHSPVILSISSARHRESSQGSVQKEQHSWILRLPSSPYSSHNHPDVFAAKLNFSVDPCWSSLYPGLPPLSMSPFPGYLRSRVFSLGNRKSLCALL